MTHTPAQLREIDAQVAERVFGYRPVEFLRDLQDGCYIVSSDHGILLQIGKKAQSWHPTESAADAMAVLKKCAEKVRHTPSFAIGSDGKWFPNYTTHELLPRSETLELAICKFALKLYEV